MLADCAAPPAPTETRVDAAISFISVAHARQNLVKQAGSTDGAPADFAALKVAAEASWRRRLSVVTLGAPPSPRGRPAPDGASHDASVHNYQTALDAAASDAPRKNRRA